MQLPDAYDPFSKEKYDFVVCALCQNTAETEQDQVLWENHKSRLHVNAGCGAICTDEMRRSDHNKEFVLISEDRVPEWIKKDFLALL